MKSFGIVRQLGPWFAVAAVAMVLGCSGDALLEPAAVIADTGTSVGEDAADAGSEALTDDAQPDALEAGEASLDAWEEAETAAEAGLDASEDGLEAGWDTATEDVADASGEPLPCEQQPEVCNGIDDNCNGVKDEGDPGGGQDCSVPGKLGECLLGTWHCSSGMLKCVQNGPASPEICDGKDNDCDGQIDNNPAGTGNACKTNLPGVCAAGTMVCEGGALACHQTLQAGTEVCNGLDDDCDGTVDNGFPGSGQPCTVTGQNPNTPCAQGQTNCFGGQNACSQVVFPSSEVCDGKDNDCNGTIDDPVVVNGMSCSTGVPGICSTGKTQCVAGTSSCVPDVPPGSVFEVCNGKDDDCNGQVDDVANVKLECAAKFGNALNVQDWKCTSGVCQVFACFGAYKDCDGAPGNGCEVNAGNDVNHCGQCGVTCTAVNGTPACIAGQCAVLCAPGWGNCDGNPNNGCETSLSTPQNCGACGAQCSNANGTTSCTAGACSPLCAAGWGSCDGNPNNGCETSLKTNADCGACAAPCVLPNASASCASGTCQLGTCGSGWADCNGMVMDGCESNTNSSLSNCGGCGVVCAAANATASCTAGACNLTCNSGWTNCDNNPANGCETNTANSAQNCGACGVTCSYANASASCVGGTCQLGACSAGWGNCDANPGNGCEVNTLTDPNNCGGCGIKCTGSCTNGSCATTLVDITPPSGTLYDPGSNSVWSARYYELKFNSTATIAALEWRINLPVGSFIRAQIWDPATSLKVATGSTVNGDGTVQWYRSNISFTPVVGKTYRVGFFLSNANAVFPRKDSPSYPYNVSNITVSSCWSTSSATEDLYPTSSNSWGPFFRVVL